MITFYRFFSSPTLKAHRFGRACSLNDYEEESRSESKKICIFIKKSSEKIIKKIRKSFIENLYKKEKQLSNLPEIAFFTIDSSTQPYLTTLMRIIGQNIFAFYASDKSIIRLSHVQYDEVIEEALHPEDNIEQFVSDFYANLREFGDLVISKPQDILSLFLDAT